MFKDENFNLYAYVLMLGGVVLGASFFATPQKVEVAALTVDSVGLGVIETASIPRARPEATTNPSRLSSSASLRAIRWPSDEALRAPTSATIGRRNTTGFPTTQSMGGASLIWANSLG